MATLTRVLTTRGAGRSYATARLSDEVTQHTRHQTLKQQDLIKKIITGVIIVTGVLHFITIITTGSVAALVSAFSIPLLLGFAKSWVDIAREDLMQKCNITQEPAEARYQLKDLRHDLFNACTLTN